MNSQYFSQIIDLFPVGDGNDILVHAGPAVGADLAFLQHHRDALFFLQDADVGKRVAVDGHDVGEFACFERAQIGRASCRERV